MQKDAILESEKEYIAQFDPTSVNYHGGSTTPVPLGGARVPQSMASEHPENFNIAATEPTSEDLGPEYQRIEQERTNYTNLKKTLDKLSPFVEAIFRHNQNYKTKGDKTNEKHLQLHKADVAREQKQIQNIQASVLEILNKSTENENKQIRKEVEEILKQSRNKFETKEELTEFGFKTKRLTAKLFGDTKKQLQQLKKIKKQYKAAQKVESTAETQPVQNQNQEKPAEQPVEQPIEQPK